MFNYTVVNAIDPEGFVIINGEIEMFFIKMKDITRISLQRFDDEMARVTVIYSVDVEDDVIDMTKEQADQFIEAFRDIGKKRTEA